MKYVPMTDNELCIQAETTKTASYDGLALDMGDGYTPGGLGQALAAVVNVSALDATTGNESYALKLQESDDGATGWADIGPALTVAEVGIHVVKGLCTNRYLRLVLTAGGTTPSITYKAYLGL